jgi:sugar phosphate isomerase/epimerase
MRFAYSSNAYRRWPIDEAIRRIAAIGFVGFELMADEPHAWPATMNSDSTDALRKGIAKSGLVVSNINAFMMNAVENFWHPSWIEPDASYRRLRLQHTIEALRMAKLLGATCVTTEPGGPLPKRMSRAHAMDIFVEGLQAALRVAEDVNVMLLVEPEPGLLIENGEQFFELSKRVDSPMFGLNFDVGHFYCVGDPLPETIDQLQSWTRHYHLEDIAASRIHEHLVPGTGAIDFRAVLRAIRKTGYDGWLTIELYPYLDDPDGAGRQALDFLSPLLPE